MTSVAAISAATSAYFSYANFSKNLQSQQLANCSRVLADAEAFKFSIYTKCIPDKDKPSGFACWLGGNSEPAAITDPAIVRLRELDNSLLVLEISWPIDQPYLVDRLRKTAIQIMRSRLDNAGAFNLIGALDLFNKDLSSLSAACREIATKGHLGPATPWKEEMKEQLAPP
jgi:hypothetical protein